MKQEINENDKMLLQEKVLTIYDKSRSYDDFFRLLEVEAGLTCYYKDDKPYVVPASDDKALDLKSLGITEFDLDVLDDRHLERLSENLEFDPSDIERWEREKADEYAVMRGLAAEHEEDFNLETDRERELLGDSRSDLDKDHENEIDRD